MTVLTREIAEALIAEQGLDVVIPDGYTSIERSAFDETNLTSILIPDGVTTIGDRSFADNQLTSIEIPESVTTIDYRAFAGNQLTSVEIPESVTTIGDRAFVDNQLTSIEIPEGVTKIGDWAFGDNQLTSVEIPGSVVYVSGFSFNQLKDVEIAESVTTIGGYAFYRNQLVSIEIPDSVAKIGDWAFGDNQLTSVEIPESVTKIGDHAFEGNQLLSVEIPEGVTKIGDYAFYRNELISVEIPDGVTTIGDGVFAVNQLTSIEIPDGVIHIGVDAFRGNQLTSIVIPDSVAFIGEDAFVGNRLTSVEIPDGVATIGAGAFSGNQLTSVIIPDDSNVHPNAFAPEVKIIRRSMVVERFKIEDVETHSHGVSLQLNDTPDMNVFGLYVGAKSDDQDPSVVLTNSSNEEVNLSAHWEDETKQLHLLSNQVLEDGDYTLKIRADGLVSQSGDLLDGNGDGVDGDDYEYSFTHSTPNHFISVGDTARSAGQDLSINGKHLKDGITGIPIHLSTTSSLQSVSGEISYDSDLLKGVSLAKGSDLPSDWIVNYSESSPGTLAFTVSGQSVTTGSIQDTLRFIGQVDGNAADSYGATSLIQATITDSSAGQISFKSDPGLMVNAYSGDTTGNGSHSSLDASRVQRVVVGLDSGFDAFDDINPALIGDTTGNGSLSSLDASRIQQEVVGLPVDTFPLIPLA